MLRVLLTKDPTGQVLLNDMLLEKFAIKTDHCPCNSAELISRLRSERYDAVVLPVTMNDVQAAWIVRQYDAYYASCNLQKLLPDMKPIFFAVQAFSDEDNRNRLVDLGFADVLTLPVSEFKLCECLNVHLAHRKRVFCEKEEQLRLKYSSILLELGIHPNLKGHAYLSECLVHLSKDPEALYQATKVLYPQVASRMQTSASNLERTMRSALSSMMKCADPQIFKKYLSNPMAYRSKKGMCVTVFLGQLLHYANSHRDAL